MCGCLILILLKTNGIHIVDKLEMCAANLSNWNKYNFQHLRRGIDDFRRKIDIMCNHVDVDNINSLILKGIVWLNFLCKRLLFRSNALKPIGYETEILIQSLSTLQPCRGGR